MYNSARMIGVTIGIIVGLIIAIFIIRYVNRNKKLTTEYDEMQKQIRGEGYKYAFYAVLILEAVLCVLTLGVVLPAEPYVVHFFAIFVGIFLWVSQCRLAIASGREPISGRIQICRGISFSWQWFRCSIFPARSWPGGPASSLRTASSRHLQSTCCAA